MWVHSEVGAEQSHKHHLGCLGIAHVLESLGKQLLIPRSAGSEEEDEN